MTKQTDLCFTRRHMPIRIVAFHTYALAVSRESGIFYRSDRRDAGEFRADKGTIVRYVAFLADSGWLVLHKASERLANGRFSATEYTVLSHEEWAAAHPGQCRTACTQNGGRQQPVRKMRTGTPESPVRNLHSSLYAICDSACTQNAYIDGEERMKRENEGSALTSLSETSPLEEAGKAGPPKQITEADLPFLNSLLEHTGSFKQYPVPGFTPEDVAQVNQKLAEGWAVGQIVEAVAAIQTSSHHPEAKGKCHFCGRRHGFKTDCKP